MNGTGTQADPYVITSWEELEALSDRNLDGIYVELSNSATSTIIDLRGKTLKTIIPNGWHINGNGWIIRNAKKGGSLFWPKNAAITYFSDIHFVNFEISNGFFSYDLPLASGEWQRGHIAWKNSTFSGKLINSSFTCSYADIKSDVPTPLFDCCRLVIHGGGGFESDVNENCPIVKDSVIEMTEATEINGVFNNSKITGSYTSAVLSGSTSIIDATIGTLSGSGGRAMVVNSARATVPSGFVSATAAQINDEFFLDSQGFAIGEDGIDYELHEADLERGSYRRAGGTSDDGRFVRCTQLLELTGDRQSLTCEVDTQVWSYLEVYLRGYTEDDDTSVVWYQDDTWVDLETEEAFPCDNPACTYLTVSLSNHWNDSMYPNQIDYIKLKTDASPWVREGDFITNGRVPNAPPPVDPVKQFPYITLHHMNTKQDEFDNNGLAILFPTSCKVTEELNGGWSLVLEHPIDNEGKYKYIREKNYIKVLGQIFTIVKTEFSYTGNSGKCTAWAEHVFYQLNDPWIPVGSCIQGGRLPVYDEVTGYKIIAAAMGAAKYCEQPDHIIFDYDYSSDMHGTPEDPLLTLYGVNKWKSISSGMTVVDFLLGSDGFIGSFGGELYRDNFYFSINSRMEYAKENAFEIRADLNAKSISCTIDTSNYCTYFKGYDDIGNWLAVCWVGAIGLQFTHNVVREKQFDSTWGQEDASYEFRFRATCQQAMDYFKANCAPRIVYSINVKDIVKLPEYENLKNFRFKVGDKGRIYDKRLQMEVEAWLPVEITRTVTNGITGEVETVQIGETRHFTRAYSLYKEPIQYEDTFTPQPVEAELRLMDKNRKLLRDKDNKKIIRKVVYNES